MLLRKDQRSIALRAAFAAALAAAVPAAQAGGADAAAGYLTAAGSQAVTDSSGECWHTGEWKPGMRFGRCEPAVLKAALPPVPAQSKIETSSPKTQAAAPAVPLQAPLRLSADALFDFDSAALRPDGRDALAALAGRIAHSGYRSVEITGHADPLGTPSYNRLLSERRAQAVRGYFAARGLDAGRISAKGVGSAEPVTAGQCDGLPQARLVRCLQPDRYAEVIVVATAQAASAQ